MARKHFKLLGIHKYAQMDYILINDLWKNAVTDAWTTVLNTVVTDHKLMIADVRFKLKKKPPNNAERPMTFHAATKEHKESYNDRVRELLNTSDET